MMNSVLGTYDGRRIVMDEDIRMYAGQKVIITVLDASLCRSSAELPDIRRYIGLSCRSADDAGAS